MQTALRITTTVQTGGKVEIVSPELPQNQSVEVIILFPVSDRSGSAVSKRSAADILAEASGHRLFHTEEDVAKYLREERNNWES